ncbi:hypothetical protein LCGC14_3013330 [marine sediment metagenome]|uniref:Uncharacterized protein n=1 Tax=marine sediment metagenome TaxID=412755 RepID=A0A0F8ZNN9_9ZZZZ
MAKTQGPHHAPDEPRVKVLALAGEGYSKVHIAELTRIPRATVTSWIREAEAVIGNKPILDKWTRRSLQALDLIGDGLDAIEEDGDAKKNLMVLNVIAGTGTDKLQKESAPTVQVDKVLIIVNAEKPSE